jgi:high-affinity K+ transport system ATPase subunit B
VTFLESIAHPSLFDWLITIWLALTVFFGNFAEAVAESRGKAQADSLRRLRVETDARRQRRTAAKIASRRPIWSEATWSCARRATVGTVELSQD